MTGAREVAGRHQVLPHGSVRLVVILHEEEDMAPLVLHLMDGL